MPDHMVSLFCDRSESAASRAGKCCYRASDTGDHRNEKGIDVVVLGCGGGAAHATEEHITVVDMKKATAIIRHLLYTLAWGG